MVYSAKPPKALPAQVTVSAGNKQLILRNTDGNPLGLSDVQHTEVLRVLEAALRQLSGYSPKNGHPISNPGTLHEVDVMPDPHLHRNGADSGQTTTRDGASTRVAINWSQRRAHATAADTPDDPSP